MATIKAYSVSETGGSQSSVYSISPLGADGGGSQAYLHSTKAGMTEGRTKTLIAGDRTVPSPAKSDVASIKTVVVGTAARDITAATKVICTTTTTKGNGAGLIVVFTTQSDGKANATNSNYAIEDGGEGYAQDDTVTVDGFPGCTLTVNKAT